MSQSWYWWYSKSTLTIGIFKVGRHEDQFLQLVPTRSRWDKERIFRSYWIAKFKSFSLYREYFAVSKRRGFWSKIFLSIMVIKWKICMYQCTVLFWPNFLLYLAKSDKVFHFRFCGIKLHVFLNLWFWNESQVVLLASQQVLTMLCSQFSHS